MRGFELSAVGEIAEGWSISAGYSHLDTEVTEGAPIASDGTPNLTYIPGDSFTLWSSYRFPFGLEIAGGARHNGGLHRGTDGAKGVVRDPRTGDLEVVTVTADNEADVLVHDAHAASPTTAFALSRLADPQTLHHTPIGVFRDVERPVYDTTMADQLEAAVEQHGKGDLAAVLAGTDTWSR